MPDFFLVVCRSRKRYALYLILLPKFHQISATLKPLTLGVSPSPLPKDIFPKPYLTGLFFELCFFLWCPLCFNALTSLQAEGGYRSIWTCCRSAVSLSLLLSVYQGQVLTLLHILPLIWPFPFFCPFAQFISHTFSSYLSACPVVALLNLSSADLIISLTQSHRQVERWRSLFADHRRGCGQFFRCVHSLILELVDDLPLVKAAAVTTACPLVLLHRQHLTSHRLVFLSSPLPLHHSMNFKVKGMELLIFG